MRHQVVEGPSRAAYIAMDAVREEAANEEYRMQTYDERYHW